MVDWNDEAETRWYCDNYTENHGIFHDGKCFSYGGMVRRDENSWGCSTIGACGKGHCAINGVCSDDKDLCDTVKPEAEAEETSFDELLCDEIKVAESSKSDSNMEVYFYKGNCYMYATMPEYYYYKEGGSYWMFKYDECGDVSCMINGLCPDQAQVHDCMLGAPQWPLALFVVFSVLILLYRFFVGCRWKP